MAYVGRGTREQRYFSPQVSEGPLILLLHVVVWTGLELWLDTVPPALEDLGLRVLGALGAAEKPPAIPHLILCTKLMVTEQMGTVLAPCWDWQ